VKRNNTESAFSEAGWQLFYRRKDWAHEAKKYKTLMIKIEELMKGSKDNVDSE
jgi:hypothetical protein